jgi:hypothetical protein
MHLDDACDRRRCGYEAIGRGRVVFNPKLCAGRARAGQCRPCKRVVNAERLELIFLGYDKLESQRTRDRN